MTALRELAITYGAITAGGISTAYLLDGFTRHAVTDGKAESFIEYDITVAAGSAAALAQYCAALEREFRTPRKALTVTQAGINLLHVAHDAATGGFNTEPEIRKVGQVGDSGRSRRYTVRVRYETPADTVSTSGLRESSVNVEYDESRIRTIRIVGTFTGVPGTVSARARYEAAIAAHAASVLSSLSVTTSELVGEPTTEHDYDDKVLRFERTYKEIIFGQGQDSASDDADIVNQKLTVTRREFSEDRSVLSQGQAEAVTSEGGAGGAAIPLAVFDLRYEASIIKGTDPKTKYDSIRAWLIGQFNAVYSQGSFALTVERIEVDRPNNRLMVDMTAEGAVRTTKLVRRTGTSDIDDQEPIVLRPAWTGDPLAHYAYQGHRNLTKTVSVSSRYFGSVGESSSRSDSLNAAKGFAGDLSGWIMLRSATSYMPVRIGIEGSGRTLDMADVSATIVYRRVNLISGAAGGSGGETVTVATAPSGSFHGNVRPSRGGLVGGQ